ncbi:MAG: YbaY family lipoprotein [Candidatus Acidiferrum sp.]
MTKKLCVLFLAIGVLTIEISPAAQEPVPESHGQPQSTMKRAIDWKRFDYTCENGQKLVVYLHDQTAKVRYNDNNYLMKQTRSADGERYSDGKVVWWGKGNGGFLQEDTEDGNGAMILKDCKLDAPTSGSARATTVTGTVSYLQRMALPANAIVVVQLQDSSLADAPAKVLAEDKITLGGRQVPIRFSVIYDSAKIDERRTYTVNARILVDGQLRFVSDKSYPVLTHGNKSSADLVLKQVPDSTPRQPQN